MPISRSLDIYTSVAYFVAKLRFLLILVLISVYLIPLHSVNALPTSTYSSAISATLPIANNPRIKDTPLEKDVKDYQQICRDENRSTVLFVTPNQSSKLKCGQTTAVNFYTCKVGFRWHTPRASIVLKNIDGQAVTELINKDIPEIVRVGGPAVGGDEKEGISHLEWKVPKVISGFYRLDFDGIEPWHGDKPTAQFFSHPFEIDCPSNNESHSVY